MRRWKISLTHGFNVPLLTMRVPMFQGKAAGCFVSEGNAFATNLTYDAPCFILAFWRCGRASGALGVTLGRVISHRGRLALARTSNTLVSARGDGSKGYAHEGADSDGDAIEVATLQVTFLVRSAGTTRRVRTDGCPRPYPRIWMFGATTEAMALKKKKKKRKSDRRYGEREKGLICV